MVEDASLTRGRLRSLRRCGKYLVGSWLSVASASAAQAQVPVEHQVFPGRTYDPSVPVPSRTLGYALGKDLATYAEMVPYIERLVAASKGKARFGTHGESYEGR